MTAEEADIETRRKMCRQKVRLEGGPQSCIRCQCGFAESCVGQTASAKWVHQDKKGRDCTNMEARGIERGGGEREREEGMIR